MRREYNSFPCNIPAAVYLQVGHNTNVTPTMDRLLCFLFRARWPLGAASVRFECGTFADLRPPLSFPLHLSNTMACFFSPLSPCKIFPFPLLNEQWMVIHTHRSTCMHARPADHFVEGSMG